jgi:hypothetical protein
MRRPSKKFNGYMRQLRMSDWQEQIPEELRENPLVKDSPDLATFVNRAIETKRMVGSSIRPPGQDAAPEERQKFESKLADLGYAPADTAPESPSGYEVQVEEDVKAFAEKRLETYHKAGLGKRAAERLVKAEAEQYKESIGAANGLSTAVAEKMRERWGDNVSGALKDIYRAAENIETVEGAVSLREAIDLPLYTPDGRLVSLAHWIGLQDMLKNYGASLGEDKQPTGGQNQSHGSPGASAEQLERELSMKYAEWSGMKNSDPMKAEIGKEVTRLENELGVARGEPDLLNMSEEEIIQGFSR